MVTSFVFQILHPLERSERVWAALLVTFGHWSLLVSWEKLHPFTPVARKILILPM